MEPEGDGITIDEQEERTCKVALKKDRSRCPMLPQLLRPSAARSAQSTQFAIPATTILTPAGYNNPRILTTLIKPGHKSNEAFESAITCCKNVADVVYASVPTSCFSRPRSRKPAEGKGRLYFERCAFVRK